MRRVLLPGLALCLLLALLAGCATQHPQLTNVESRLYGHNLSAFTLSAQYQRTLPQTRTEPTRHIYEILQPLVQEGVTIVPAGSEISVVQYYPDTPYQVVEMIKIEGSGTWTPAQGVISKTSRHHAFVTLSHVAVPLR